MTGFTLNGKRLSYNGDTDRYYKNVAAIELLRQLQRNGTKPGASLTDQQLMTLAHYSAFGSSSNLNMAFGQYRGIQGITTEDEQQRIKRSSLTAFYTSQTILDAKWSGLAPILRQYLAANGGPLKVLEPAFGVGMYVATMPQDIREQSEITAVEMDAVSSQIAAYLHPDVTLHGSLRFEETDLPEGYYDLVVSNVPFGGTRVHDLRFVKDERFLTRTVHDYFLARSLKLVRPGGLVAILTSYGTMDKEDERFRCWVAERADLVYAVRLPQGTFSLNAGTECGTDLLIFRRYDEGDDIVPAPMWTTTEMGNAAYIGDWNGTGFTTASKLDDNKFTLIPHGRDANGYQTPPRATLRMNYLFASQADATIGTTNVVAYGDYFFSYVSPPKSGTVANALALDIAAWTLELEPQRPVTEKPQAAKKKASFVDRESPLAQRMIAIEVVMANLIEADGAGRETASALREKLNELYDAFVGDYGVIHTPKNLKALKGEPEILRLRALENNVRVVGSKVEASKATIFSRPVVQRNVLNPTETLSPGDAILYVLEEKGYLDWERMQHLTAMNDEELFDALKGQVYRNHVQEAQDALMPRAKAKYPQYVLAEEYLSGNVREKFFEASEAARKDPRFQENAEALRNVIPKALTSEQLRVNMRAPWIPTSDYEAFISEIIPNFGYGYNKGIVKYHQLLARWVIEDPGYARQSNEATVTWGTSRIHALDIIEATMNQRQITVRDETMDGKMVVNQKETLLAREKAQRIEERWATWLWEDYDREKRLVEQYNVLFNSVVKRTYSGKHLTFPGMNTAILRGNKLADYQADAVWMALNVPGCLLDLRVGAGKTYIGLAIAHEGKRLGLFSKPAVTVPNHLVGQWAIEANKLYPAMRVLAMAPEDFTKERRGTFLSRIMTEDWDLIIIGHSTFGLIEPGEIAREYIDGQIIEYRAYLEDLQLQQQNERTRSKKKSIKDIEKALENFETQIKDMDAKVKHDDLVGWDELGIDWLAVDEAHEFKNLGIPTSMGSIPGVPKGNSQRAMDMRIKTWDMLRRDGRVVFATGTPVLNTLGEVFIMQKYLQEEVLVAHGINHFDSWASTFATTQTMFEMTPDGGGFRMNTRLSKFVNLPELFSMWFQFVFSRSNDALNLPTPKIMGGRPLGFSVPGTPTLKKLVQSFVARVDAIKSGSVEPTEDNMLKVTSDGRKAALDVRLVLGGPEERVCKINYLVNLVHAVYEKYHAAKGTQLIYCELATPKGRADGKETKKKDGPKSKAQEEREVVQTRQAAERAELRLLVQGDREESPTGEDEEVETKQEQQDNNFVYHEIRAKLGKLGIPADEIAFIQHYKTQSARNQLFADMNAGRVRVLICSKQSTGMNIQRRLVAEWNLDAPWRPGDLEQRYGRIERQGNAWAEIIIGNMVTEGSFDGYTWQLLETKARFIQQMRSQDITIREIDDISAVVLTASEIKALASGNPAIRRKVEIEASLMKLDAVFGGYKDGQRRMEESIRQHRQGRAEHKQRKVILGHAIKAAAAFPAVPGQFKVSLIEGAMLYTPKLFTTEVAEGEEPLKPGLVRKAAGEHLQRLIDHLNGQAEQMNQVIDRTVGYYRGLLIRVKAAPKKHHMVGSVYLAVNDEDEQPSLVYTIGGETDEGLFVSADAGVRGLQDAHDAVDGRVEEITRKIKTIETEQAKPWDEAVRYAALQAEYSEITAVLYADKEVEKATETAEVVKVIAPPVELPLVVLPEPADPEAMEASMQLLIKEDLGLVMQLKDVTFTVNPATQAVSLVTKQVVNVKSVPPKEIEVGQPTMQTLYAPAKIEVATETFEESFVPRSSGFSQFSRVKLKDMGKNKGKPTGRINDEVEQSVMF